jgi:hypothetical protein
MNFGIYNSKKIIISTGLNVFRNFMNIEMCDPEGVELTFVEIEARII